MYSATSKACTRTAVALLLIACGDRYPTASNFGMPFTVGVITAADPGHGYLVETSASPGVPAKTFFHLDSRTTIERGGKNATVNDLATGRSVAVWATSLVPGSEPPEILAKHVLIYLEP